MSGREFAKVKWAIETMLLALVDVKAANIAEIALLQSTLKAETEEWWRCVRDLNAEFDEYTTVIDTLYPDNEKKMREWTQRLDDKEETAFITRQDANDAR